MLNDLLVVKRSDPIYNAHSYLTKVPVDAIIPFITEFTQESEVVVDMFAGSGMTAVAAKMTNRNAIVSDISVLGRHIGTGYLTGVSRSDITEITKKIISDSKESVGQIYLTNRCTDNSEVFFNKTIWSFVYECNDCKSEINYYETFKSADYDAKKMFCSVCNSPFIKSKSSFLHSVPVLVDVDGEAGRQVEQTPQDIDFNNIKKAENSNVFDVFPSKKIEKSREMYKRSALEKWNLTETKSFFSARNATVLLDLWTRINAVDNIAVRQKLRFTFTAILPRASKRYQWSLKSPLNAAIQNYYIAPVFYEWNVYDLFTRKINAVLKSDSYIENHSGVINTKHEYFTASADNLDHLDNESVDLVFTDPPFGSNIFYSDMNLFHEAWLGTYTDNSREAVMKTVGPGKESSKSYYQAILTGAFREARRVLKDGKKLAVVFGSSQGSIWSVVQQSLYDAGFTGIPEKIVILDKGQRSVKGLNSGKEKVSTLDLIVVVGKSDNFEKKSVLKIDDYKPYITSILDSIDISRGFTASHIYMEVLRLAMKNCICIADIDLSDIIEALQVKGYKINQHTGILELAQS